MHSTTNLKLSKVFLGHWDPTLSLVLSNMEDRKVKRQQTLSDCSDEFFCLNKVLVILVCIQK